MTTEIIPNDTEYSIDTSDQLAFPDHMKNIINDYYKKIAADDLTPKNVYESIMSEIELPLIQSTMAYTNNNQFRSAKILGLNRGTFRKKLKYYRML